MHAARLAASQLNPAKTRYHSALTPVTSVSRAHMSLSWAEGHLRAGGRRGKGCSVARSAVVKRGGSTAGQVAR